MRIKTKYGDWYTVREIIYTAVYVYETNTVIHVSNVVEVKEAEPCRG